MFIFLQGRAESDEAKYLPKKFPQTPLVLAYCTPERSPSDKCSSAGSNASLSGLVSVENDDSDSEIFRVKRRSPILVDRRKDSDLMNSKTPARQVHFY